MADITMHHAAHGSDTHMAAENENRKFAMWLYLTSEVVIFSIMIAGYTIFRANQSIAVELVKDSLGIALVAANTFVLLASSYAMVMGLRAIRMGSRKGFYGWIALTAILGTVFLGGQYLEYSELGHLGVSLEHQNLTVSTNLFESVNHVEVELADGEVVDLREGHDLPEDAEIVSYHVDFDDISTDGTGERSLFQDVNYSRVNAPYTSDFILLNTSAETLTVVSEQAQIDTILAAQYDEETGVMTRRAREVALNEVAVETIEGDIVPFSEIITGRAVNLAPQQYDTLNLYFRSLIGNSAADYGMRFYAPTAFHGAHVLIGVIWALIVLWRGYKGYYDKNAIGLEMFGLYWHFVDVVWIVLFTLIYLI
jgi:heme/copper-type cytochrome/quinol oxidase subunit 3